MPVTCSDLSASLAQALAFAQAHECPWPRDPAAVLPPGAAPWGVHHEDPAPYNRLRGPVHARGPQSGVLWQRGHELAAWGEPDRSDLTFSVAKTYLALLAGIARREGLLPDLHRSVAEQLPGIGFDGSHNRRISWAMLLEQTSEWEGECFGLPDQVDRWRKVAQDPRPAGGPKGGARPLQPPGRYWEYNDVRINQLALALLHLLRRPLPEVFLNEILRPLGGGEGFAWRGYDDAWVELPGLGPVQSVPGGTHWGGGVSVSARDQARVGQLLLDGGAHGGRQILPRDWVSALSEPCAIAPFYGRLVWLNRDGRSFPAASTQAFFMMGAGGHVVWVEPAWQSVLVLRWFDGTRLPALLQRFAAVLAPEPQDRD
ncbi:serine hydrolase domain-containing protein [Kinneretia asaccharophila]|uniref:CubicO group peptidase (Beta-lactamase class C family) n=1 Tax=Roseateles asaccharophilus TaxID=582607 RepID=A0A4R6NBJ3_9BURK|nr:serine hydrolase domain-containing protein [Roseateles asaccharophilus]MDN3546667.1 serine hydrolase domain-containing protein [Roseateles asaccharophilus]TDP12890.1 CubicO group peptidase (beta-lactamase class C family) [Roseateles asaccharophilus]